MAFSNYSNREISKTSKINSNVKTSNTNKVSGDGVILEYPKNIQANLGVPNLKYIKLTALDSNSIGDAVFEEIGKLVSQSKTPGAKELSDATIKIFQRTSKKLATFYLPLPNEFSDRTSHGYSEESTGNVAGIIDTMNSAIGEAQTFMGAFDRGISIGQNIDISSVNTFGNSLKNLITKSSSSNIASSRIKQLPVIDPLKWQKFTGTDLRSFELSWDLVPQSYEEALNIFKIIMALKKYSHPDQTAGQLLIPPSSFILEFSNPVLHLTINPGVLVLTDVSTSFGDGSYISTYADGTPKKTNLSLSFKEFRQKYEADWSTEYSLTTGEIHERVKKAGRLLGEISEYKLK